MHNIRKCDVWRVRREAAKGIAEPVWEQTGEPDNAAPYALFVKSDEISWKNYEIPLDICAIWLYNETKLWMGGERLWAK